MPRRLPRVLAPLFASALTAATLAAAPTTQATPAPAAEDDPVLTVRLPSRIVAYTYSGKKGEVALPFGLRAGAAPVEIWSKRPSYDEEIRTVWRSPDGDVELPVGVQKDFSGLDGFVKITVKNLATDKSWQRRREVCLNSWEGYRSDPAAPATSPYPYDCPANAFTLGSVQGIQQGWTTNVLGYQSPLYLAKGKYDITVSITSAYARAFGLDTAERSRTARVIVKKRPGSQRGPEKHSAPAPKPNAKAPTGPATSDAQALAGPVPNLRSLPAWGIEVSPNGKNLNFAATVWNAGNSPLVVDGFRVEGEDEMDGYQYFFDADGNQTGYQPVGKFHWDPKPTHLHWHFKDFATYTLLHEDMSQVALSKKEAFCLANTDFVDATVPDAAWRTESDDLTTACGEEDSQSIREVLAAGWGDTYAQFRAGQSFKLDGLSNGVYYIKVEANAKGNLVESDTTDNVSLRKIILSGKPGNRKVKVPQVGIIDE